MSTIKSMSRREKENNLEIGAKKPNLALIKSELEQAQGDIDFYLRRNNNAYNSWHSRWPGQTTSGRKEAEDAFPWKGASDSRLRTVKQIVREHVLIAMAAFTGAKVQATSTRPFAEGQARNSNQATKLLQWMLWTHMRAELQREVPLTLNWRFGLGASLLGIKWETARRLEYHPLTVPDLADWIALQENVPEEDRPRLFMQLQEALSDPAQEETLIGYLMTLSNVVTHSMARTLVTRLRQERHAEIPVPYVFKSKPVWTARRIGVDALFPAETGDLQAARWYDEIEWVTETELRDRIETEGYAEQFVEAALKQKGKGMNGAAEQTRLDRAEAYSDDSRSGMATDFEDMIQLHHFYHKAINHGTPCLHCTIFSPHVGGKGAEEHLCAKHETAPYPHGLYPAVALRYEYEARPILSSQGIAELAYTWEQEEKVQADGLANRTSLSHSPPLIVPYNRVSSIKGSFAPRAVLGVTRPQEIQWMPQMPSDRTPVDVLEAIAQRRDRFFPLFGVELDPELKMLWRQKIATDVLGEFDLAIDQTFQLMQFYLPDDEVAETVGTLTRPFRQSREAIQGAHEITTTFDARSLDEEHVSKKMDLAIKALTFNQGGNANFGAAYKLIMEMIDPDWADSMVETDEVASERERREEKQALMEMMLGMEPDKPQFVNHGLRLQVIQEVMQRPGMLQKVASQPDVMELLKNRIAHHQANIQQYQENPGIGRALSTETFTRKAPRMALAG